MDKEIKPKGFPIPDGYMGFVSDDVLMSFPTEDEYLEYLIEKNKDKNSREKMTL